MATLKLWQHPSNYIGKQWNGYVSAGIGQTRDSSALERANFETARSALCDLPGVEIVSENHWACGWIEWIAIPLCSFKALEIAQDLADRLKEYPCLDEQLWSDFESEEANDYWTHASKRERIRLCANAGESIFAARLPYPPDGVFDALRDQS